MKVSIVTEVRIILYNNNYYVDASFLKIIERYKKAFNNITIFSRVIEGNNNDIKGLKIIEKNIKIINTGSISSFVFKKVNKEYIDIIKDSNLIVFRVPSIVSLKLYRLIKKEKKKYLCEIMGCAFDAYWNHGIIGKIIAIPMYFMMKVIIKNADYCLYVTKYFLQKRYPTNAYCINASNVNINEPVNYKDYSNFIKNNITLFTAAALNVKYKGQQYVIRAIKELKNKGINVNYYLAGKGKADYLVNVAKKCHVYDNIHILGMLDKEGVNKMMLNTDIYIQPSLQEGLPRSLIEAMNCGLVCAGAKTAGIPELLNRKYIFKRGNVKSIVKCLSNIVNENLDEIGKSNSIEAKKYYCITLDKKREEFYNKIVEDLSKNEQV